MDATDPDYPAYTLAEAAEYWRVSIPYARLIRKRNKLGRRSFETTIYHVGPVWKLSYNEIMSIPQSLPREMMQGVFIAQARAMRAYADEIDAAYPDLV